VDAANIMMNGGFAMRYDVLREYCGQSDTPIRLNTYVTFDAERAQRDTEYRGKQFNYYSKLRGFGFKVIVRNIRWYYDDGGNRYGKANVDLDMAVDMLLQTRNLDKVYLLTGDGDFKRVVQAIQDSGVRVELIAFRNVSRELTHEVDLYTSGYLIPDLLPFDGDDVNRDVMWGSPGSRVRGMCCNLQETYGFMKVMQHDYNYMNVFFHESEMRSDMELNGIYEFDLKETDRGLQGARIVFIE